MDGKRSRKAVCAGHICLDITPAFSLSKTYERIGELLVPGQLVPVGKPDIHLGGSVANTGLAMKFLGADVELMGKVGDDDFGRLVLSMLKEKGADCGMKVVSGEETSYSVVVSVPGVDRVILHDAGANNTFGPEDVDYTLVGNASLFHFGYPTAMRRMQEENGRNLVEIFRRVKELGVATSLDTSSLEADSEEGRVDWEAILRGVMPYVDFFVPSVEELAFMIERPRYEQWRARSNGGDITAQLSVEEDIRPLAEKLLSWGAKIVLIKCGAPGMYLKTASREQLAKIGGGLSDSLKDWAEQEHFERSYRPERVLSGTGAGDTSIGAFLCAALEGCSWQESLHLAAATGASCVVAYDALSGLKSFEELRQKIAAGWEKA
ncbi:MAG: carbohydrate kinase family protein [Lachnospiraceae bacterium]|nr:carbohydrate kinase family protein [Lachnospiraceae bacterium]